MINGDTDFFHGKVKGAAGQYIDEINRTDNTYSARVTTIDFEEKLMKRIKTKEDLER